MYNSESLNLNILNLNILNLKKKKQNCSLSIGHVRMQRSIIFFYFKLIVKKKLLDPKIGVALLFKIWKTLIIVELKSALKCTSILLYTKLIVR